MKIKISSIMVTDQVKALEFYTEILGFVKKEDVSMGEYRWLTVTSPEERDGTELLLEGMAFPPAMVYQKALYEAGIPCTVFGVADVEQEYERLLAAGVVFKNKPTKMGPVTIVMLDDTCGNYIQLVQRN